VLWSQGPQVLLFFFAICPFVSVPFFNGRFPIFVFFEVLFFTRFVSLSITPLPPEPCSTHVFFFGPGALSDFGMG